MRKNWIFFKGKFLFSLECSETYAKKNQQIGAKKNSIGNINYQFGNITINLVIILLIGNIN